MKKLILTLTTALVCGMMFTGCKTTVTEDVDDAFYQNAFNQFVVVEERNNDMYGKLSVMYDKDTKVMYTISCDKDNGGYFTLLVNPDGSPMLYKESEE